MRAIVVSSVAVALLAGLLSFKLNLLGVRDNFVALALTFRQGESDSLGLAKFQSDLLASDNDESFGSALEKYERAMSRLEDEELWRNLGNLCRNYTASKPTESCASLLSVCTMFSFCSHFQKFRILSSPTFAIFYARICKDAGDRSKAVRILREANKMTSHPSTVAVLQSKRLIWPGH